MTGPSSSHTAGAVRIGRTARLLYGKQPKKVKVYFHGSFAETWKGHGSDKAVIGGLLGYKTFDKRLKNAYEHAKEASMEVTFLRANLGRKYHPNSIKVVIQDEEGDVEVIAESVGGGDIVIREIMGYKTELTGENDALIIRHKDYVGTLSKITAVIAKFGLNIIALSSKDLPKKEEALTTIEIEQSIPADLAKELSKVKGIQTVRVLPNIAEGEELF
jgi:L-serine dehydratase